MTHLSDSQLRTLEHALLEEDLITPPPVRMRSAGSIADDLMMQALGVRWSASAIPIHLPWRHAITLEIMNQCCRTKKIRPDH